MKIEEVTRYSQVGEERWCEGGSRGERYWGDRFRKTNGRKDTGGGEKDKLKDKRP